MLTQVRIYEVTPSGEVVTKRQPEVRNFEDGKFGFIPRVGDTFLFMYYQLQVTKVSFLYLEDKTLVEVFAKWDKSSYKTFTEASPGR